MKNKFIIGIIFSILLLLSPGVKAANFTDNQTVDANKMWTIRFTDEVKFDDLTKQGITVTDNNGNKANIGIQLGQDNSTVTVTAPQGGYTAGESYILNVKNDVHSSKGKALKNEYKLHFNIENDNNVVTFKDSFLEYTIRNQINKPTGTLYKSDVEKITKLSIPNIDYAPNQVFNISGMENLINLEYLDLDNNNISDMTPLKNLTKLEYLSLNNTRMNGINQTKDLNIFKNLTKLKHLGLEYNGISDLTPLKYLPKLEYL
ncbi:Ig-like domain-containing protein [Clostridium sp. LBM24168]